MAPGLQPNTILTSTLRSPRTVYITQQDRHLFPEWTTTGYLISFMGRTSAKLEGISLPPIRGFPFLAGMVL